MSIRYPKEGERIILTDGANGTLHVESYVVRPVDKSVYGCSVWRLKAFNVGEFNYDAGANGAEGVATLMTSGVDESDDELATAPSSPTVDPHVPVNKPKFWKPYSHLHRCCNVHMMILEPQGRKQPDRGGQLLKCPYCSVGVWSDAKNSLPASKELRELRSELFQVAKQRASLGRTTFANGESLKVPYGKLNRAEIEALMGTPQLMPVMPGMWTPFGAPRLGQQAARAEEAMRAIKRGSQPAINIHVHVEPEKIREIDLD